MGEREFAEANLQRSAVAIGALGICVGLTLLWLGAIEKALASVSAVVLTCFGESLLLTHTFPGWFTVLFAVVICNGSRVVAA